MMMPLVLLTIFVFQRGLPELTWHALFSTQQGVVYTPGSHNIGGVKHALIGTIEQVLIAAVIGVPRRCSPPSSSTRSAVASRRACGRWSRR